MQIQRIVSQHRRDFRAIYECEHCGHTQEAAGYDDTYFHQVVIPQKPCPQCGRTASADYRALSTKYPDSKIV